jgi:hypothetical protein
MKKFYRVSETTYKLFYLGEFKDWFYADIDADERFPEIETGWTYSIEYMEHFFNSKPTEEFEKFYMNLDYKLIYPHEQTHTEVEATFERDLWDVWFSVYQESIKDKSP